MPQMVSLPPVSLLFLDPIRGIASMIRAPVSVKANTTAIGKKTERCGPSIFRKTIFL
jgi:hypothetical protein